MGVQRCGVRERVPRGGDVRSAPGCTPAKKFKSAVSKYGPMLVTEYAAAGHKCRAIEAGPPVPMMIIMPLGQVTDKNRLVARRRAMAMDLEDEGCEAIERKQTRLAFV